METLINIDIAIFYFINQTIANPLTDGLMWLITNKYFLRGLYGVTIILLIVFGRARFAWVVVGSIIVVALTDQTASAWLKPYFERLRPCKALDDARLVVASCGSGWSFPSAHATNAFGQALFFSTLYRKYALYIMIFGFLVAISRVFVGVHYPGDVAFGMIIGSIEGWLVAVIIIRLNRQPWFKPKQVIQNVKTEQVQ